MLYSKHLFLAFFEKIWLLLTEQWIICSEVKALQVSLTLLFYFSIMEDHSYVNQFLQVELENRNFTPLNVTFHKEIGIHFTGKWWEHYVNTWELKVRYWKYLHVIQHEWRSHECCNTATSAVLHASIFNTWLLILKYLYYLFFLYIPKN